MVGSGGFEPPTSRLSGVTPFFADMTLSDFLIEKMLRFTLKV